jgi:hypothetical protein
MGFIGCAQAIAVWGIIVIFIAGFVFLTLYMRALYQNTLTEPAQATLTLPLTGPATIHEPRPLPSFSLPFELPDLSFLTNRSFNITLAILSSLLLTVMLTKNVSNRVPNGTLPVIVTTTPLPVAQLEIATPSATPSESEDPERSRRTATESADLIITPANAASSINVRKDANPASPKIGQITETEQAIEIGTSGDWIHVKLIQHDPLLTGWIHKDYVSPLRNQQ